MTGAQYACAYGGWLIAFTTLWVCRRTVAAFARGFLSGIREVWQEFRR